MCVLALIKLQKAFNRESMLLHRFDQRHASLKINLYSPWYRWQIAELALSNNHLLIPNISSKYRSIPNKCYIYWLLKDKINRPPIFTVKFKLLVRCLKWMQIQGKKRFNTKSDMINHIRNLGCQIKLQKLHYMAFAYTVPLVVISNFE